MVEAVPVSEAATLVGQIAGVAVVIPESFDTAVRLSIEEESAESVFRRLAEAAGARVSYTDGVVTFGDVGRAEEVAVFESGLDGAEDLKTVLKLIAGAEVEAIGARVVVAGGPGVVADVTGVVEMLEGGRDAWLVEVGVLRVTSSWLREFGAGWSASGGGSLSLDAGLGSLQGGSPIMGAGVEALIAAAFAADAVDGDAKLEATGTLYVLEGSTATLQQGDTVPVPERTVSPQGTVQTTGYTYVQTGLSIAVKARRVQRGVLLNITPRVSAVVGYVEAAPTIAESEVVVDVVAETGEWFMIAGLQTLEDTISKSGMSMPGVPRRTSSNGRKSELLVVVRASRVFGAAE